MSPARGAILRHPSGRPSVALGRSRDEAGSVSRIASSSPSEDGELLSMVSAADAGILKNS